MAASRPSPGKLYPNRTEEDQDMEMKKITLSTPPYSSDDPATDGLRMLPLEEGTSADHNVTDEAPADKPVAKGKKQADESDDEDA